MVNLYSIQQILERDFNIAWRKPHEISDLDKVLVINDDNSIDLIAERIKWISPDKKLSVKFHNVKCDFFSLFTSNLTTLEGCPNEVQGIFFIGANTYIKSLIGGPKVVYQRYNTIYTTLTSLEGLPDIVGDALRLTYSETLPLLRLINKPYDFVFSPDAETDIKIIINKYKMKSPFKKSILDCQKELIDKGFVGNAGW